MAKSDKSLTMILFKDHLKSRVIEIDFKWFDQLGKIAWLGLSIVVLSLGLALFFGIQYWRLAPQSKSVLEAEISELRSEVEQRQKIIDSLRPQAPAFGDDTSSGTPSFSAQSLMTQFILPSKLPDTQTLSIEDRNHTVTWNWGPNGANLLVKFDLQYIKSDGGHQDGTLAVLAHGKRGIYAYPDAVLSGTPPSTIFDAKKGETFSLKQFRSVLATLGPFDAESAPSHVTTWVFSDASMKNVPLIARTLDVPKFPARDQLNAFRKKPQTAQENTTQTAPKTDTSPSTGNPVVIPPKVEAPNGNP